MPLTWQVVGRLLSTLLQQRLHRGGCATLRREVELPRPTSTSPPQPTAGLRCATTAHARPARLRLRVATSWPCRLVGRGGWSPLFCDLRPRFCLWRLHAARSSAAGQPLLPNRPVYKHGSQPKLRLQAGQGHTPGCCVWSHQQAWCLRTLRPRDRSPKCAAISQPVARRDPVTGKPSVEIEITMSRQ